MRVLFCYKCGVYKRNLTTTTLRSLVAVQITSQHISAVVHDFLSQNNTYWAHIDITEGFRKIYSTLRDTSVRLVALAINILCMELIMYDTGISYH
jgi:hypothetical protein